MENSEKTFKTPSYQRRAYKNYVAKNSENTEFIEKRKNSQREYYLRNKEKILEKLKEKRDKQKVTKILDNIKELEKEVHDELQNL